MPLMHLVWRQPRSAMRLTIQFGSKETKVEVLDVQETVKKDDAKELFRYI